MTSEATTGQIPDVYGQVHPEETIDLISKKRKELEFELEKIPAADKTNLAQAQDKCPELLSDAFKLKFLRSEVFNADLAAKRYVQYWNKRVDIFGPEKAFQPLTLSQALSDDGETFSLGVITLPGTKDPSGRSIISYDPSKLDKTKYTTKSMSRCFWYVIHAAIEHEEAEKHGIILIVDAGRAQFSQFDRSIATMMTSSVKGALPIRVSAFHIVYPPTFFKIVLPILKMLLNERLRKRLRLHTGSEEKVLKNLKEKFGLSPDMLPTEIGGKVVVDHKGWLKTRSESDL